MSQINDSRFIGPSAVTSDDIKLQNNQYLLARNAADTGDVDILKIDSSNRLNLGDGGQITAKTSNLFLYDGVTCPQLTFANASGSNSIAFKAPNALAANATYNLPLTDGSSGQVLTTDGSGVLSWSTVSGGGTSWTKYTVSHTSLQAAALTNNIQLFSLGAKGVIRGIIIKHTTAFAGTGITAYSVSVGISTALQKYASAFDVYQVVGDTVGQSSNVFDFEHFTSATSIRIAATSVGANLNQSTAGSVDIYVLSETLP